MFLYFWQFIDLSIVIILVTSLRLSLMSGTLVVVDHLNDLLWPDFLWNVHKSRRLRFL
jgi:hypothetical protein